MHQSRVALALTLITLAGCSSGTAPPPVLTGTGSRSDEAARVPSRPVQPSAKVSWLTERDRVFAEFLREKSAGMIQAAAVGLEGKGTLRVELSRQVTPDETLPLTKSLVAGARKDFPDKPLVVSIYDPQGEPILKARYNPGQGVKYELAHEPGKPAADHAEAAPATASTVDPLDRKGITEADRKFATWAEEHGRSYLRYVEADLERHGRLWFGVSREVKPSDVPNLTKSLLEGARKEFPRGTLVANVFDPEGERIGRATLETDGTIRWAN